MNKPVTLYQCQLAWLMLIISGLLVSSCAGLKVGNLDIGAMVQATQKVVDMGDKSQEEEIKLGQEVATVLLKKSALHPSRELQLYVNRVGKWVSLQSARPDLPWRFAVLKDSSFNAFATPGGMVFITDGALYALDNEAELASILAHEIAHVIRKHHLEAIRKAARIEFTKDIASIVYQARQDGTSQPGYTETLLTKEAVAAVETIYFRGLDKQDEYESDQMALVLAARAGYDPFAFIAVLQKIEQRGHNDKHWLNFLERHPPALDRLDKLNSSLNAPFLDANYYQSLGERYREYLR